MGENKKSDVKNVSSQTENGQVVFVPYQTEKPKRIVCDMCGHVNAEDTALCEMCSNYLERK